MYVAVLHIIVEKVNKCLVCSQMIFKSSYNKFKVIEIKPSYHSSKTHTLDPC